MWVKAYCVSCRCLAGLCLSPACSVRPRRLTLEVLGCEVRAWTTSSCVLLGGQQGWGCHSWHRSAVQWDFLFFNLTLSHLWGTCLKVTGCVCTIGLCCCLPWSWLCLGVMEGWGRQVKLCLDHSCCPNCLGTQLEVCTSSYLHLFSGVTPPLSALNVKT